MKIQNIEVHGVYNICNTGGIEVHLAFEYGERVMYWRYCIVDMGPQKWHRSKISDTTTGRAFFRAGNMRVYLDQVICMR